MSRKREEGKGAIEDVRAGWYVWWEGQAYKVERCDLRHGMKMELEAVETGQRREVGVEEVWCGSREEVWCARSLEQLEYLRRRGEQKERPAGEVTARQLERAQRIVATVERIEAQLAAWRAQGGGQETKHLREWCKQLEEPIGVTSYYEYRRQYAQAGGQVQVLAGMLRRKTYEQTQMSRAQLHLADTLLVRWYGRKPAMRPAMVYRLAVALVQRRTKGYWIDPERCRGKVPADLVEELLGGEEPIEEILRHPEKGPLLTKIELPSRAWWYRYIRWYEGQGEGGKDVVVARYGKRAWEETYQVFDTFVHKAERPLHYVFADHCLLDVFVVDEASRQRVNRLWLTMLIDAYSRGIVGMALLYEAPCIESIQSALLHGIWPKHSQRRYGIEEEWACYGIPEELSLDNAWAHHSQSVRELTKVLAHGGAYRQMQLYFRPAYQARYGALIERFFGNLSGQLKDLAPGAIKSSHPRDVREAGRAACLLYEDLDRVLHRLIVVYQHTPHQGLRGMTPHEKWMEGLGGSVPVVPALTPEMRRVFLRRYPGTRVIRQRGVSLFGLHYSSPALGEAERVDRQGRAVEYQIRYEPQDISRLCLFRGEQWVGDVYAHELRQADGGYRQVSLWEIGLARALADKRVGETRDWLAYLNEIEQLVEERSAEKRRIWQQKSGRERRERVSAQEPEEAQGPESEEYTQLLADFES